MARKPPRRTRERILETALVLFNRLGEPHVTTADIADELNISPGNLYYHFRNKDEIIGLLFSELDASLAPLFAGPSSRDADVEDLWLLLHLLFERMGQYRFFYRDLDEITSRSRRLALAFGGLTRRTERAVEVLTEGLVAAGAMQATVPERRALARNVALVATYWMSFQRIGQLPSRDPSAGPALDPGQAAWQILAMVAPFLVGSDRALADKLGADYL